MDLLTTGLVVLAIVAAAALAWFVFVRRTSDVARDITVPTGLGGRLSRSRDTLAKALAGAFASGPLDTAVWESLEEALIGADVGVSASTRIVERVRSAGPASVEEARRLLRSGVRDALGDRRREVADAGSPCVVLVVGANGTGKTTSIAKLAHVFERGGSSTLLGAADTFRAAAGAQIRTWADRVGVDVVGGQEGADPASVAFDAIQAARARGKDYLIIDTAGRLHSKQNLMAELAKIRRVLEREAGVVGEVLLVLDATAGQNGIAQAREFFATAGVTGIVLTKLDGTARGGIVVAVEEELGIPVKFIGVGEGLADLIPFDPDQFVDALLEGS